jgi:hypothetical protein
MGKLSMSKTKYSYGWADYRSEIGVWLEITEYQYEMRYSFNPKGYEVVKRNLINYAVEEVVASGLKRDAAEGFIKILGEPK